MPWAEYRVDDYGSEKGVDISAGEILTKTIQSVKNSPKQYNWRSFYAIFNVILFRECTKQHNNSTHRIEAETNYAQEHRVALTNNPVENARRNDLQAEMTEALKQLPPEHRTLLLLGQVSWHKNGPWRERLSQVTGNSENGIKSCMGKLTRDFRRVARKHPALAEWMDERRLDISPEQENAINPQKETLRKIFGFNGLSSEEITKRTGIALNVVSCLFGDSLRFGEGSALSNQSRKQLAEWLEQHGKAHSIPEFQGVFNRMCEITMNRSFNRPGFDGITPG